MPPGNSGRFSPGGDPRGVAEATEEMKAVFLPLVVVRNGRRFVVDERWTPRSRDEIWLAIAQDKKEEAYAWLAANWWEASVPKSSMK